MNDLIPFDQLNIDLESLNFNLPTELDTLASLEAFEKQIFIASADIEEAWAAVSDGYTRAAYHIHMLLQYRLWRHRPNELGQQMYQTQDDYLKDLAQNLGRGFQPSTIKQFHTTIRMYRELGWTKDQIEQAGITTLNKVAARVDKDYTTSKPIGLRDGKLPPGTTLNEHINNVTHEVLESTNRPNPILTGRELDKHIDKHLANRKPLIEFHRIDGKDMTIIQWVYELSDDAGFLTPSRYGEVIINWQGDPPASVIEKFLNMLRVNLE